MKKTVNEIALFLGGKVVGDGGILIESIRGIDEAGPGDISFIANLNMRKSCKRQKLRPSWFPEIPRVPV